MSEHARALSQKSVLQIAAAERLSPASATLQRQCACGQHTVGGSQCSQCSKNRVNASLSGNPPRRIQAKLNVSQPGDLHELEADRTAEQVMQMPEPQLRDTPQHEPQHGGTELSRHPEVERSSLQAKAASSSASLSSHPELQTVSGSGQSLSASARSFMEPRFGHDFSQVRVHTDERAAASAREFNATAYTIGRDIVFAQGQYAPETASGRRLLAHELTHVIQQSGIQQTGASEAAAGTLQRQTIPEDFTEQQAQDYLLKLDRTGKIEDNMDSDNKARAIVNAWRLGGSPYVLTAQRKILLIEEMQSGFTGDDDELAILEILERSYNFELSMIFGAIKADDLNSDIHGSEWDQLKDFYRRRFEGGMEALLKGTITPKDYPVPFGQEIPRLTAYLLDELPGAVGAWNPACALGILCSKDSTVVSELGNLTVKEMERIEVEKWSFDGKTWSSKTVHPTGLNNPDQKLVGILRRKDCDGAAQTLFHEVRHQTQPAHTRTTQFTMEVDAYTETEKWAIERGLPEGRSPSIRTTDKTGKEAPDPAAVEQMVEKKYGGKTVTPGDAVVDHEGTATTVIKHPDGSVSKLASVAGDSYLEEPPKLINEKTVPASTWVCPNTKTP